MGSQRYLMDDLRAKYNLSEVEAFELVQPFEALNIGDSVDDAIWDIRAVDGNTDVGFRELERLAERFRVNIATLKEQITTIRRVRQSGT